MGIFALTCNPGLESLLLEECQEHFPDMRFEQNKGSVVFSSPTESALAVAEYSGIASRLFLKVAEFPCVAKIDFQKGLSKVRWSDYLDLDSTFSISVQGLVEGKGHKRSFAPLLAKDVVCDYFKAKHGKRPSVNTKDPQVHIQLYYGPKSVNVSIELTRSPLHRRGYRLEGGEAPLRENLAQAFVRFSSPHETRILDPFCGSGTILIELQRFLSRNLKNNADFIRDRPATPFWENIKAATKKLKPINLPPKAQNKELIGSDKSEKQLMAANKNCGKAGYKEITIFQKMDACNPARDYYKNSLILCNPPHGDRVATLEKAKALLGNFARKIKFDHSPCRLGLIIPDDGLAKSVGLAPTKKLKVGAGEKTYLFLIYELYAGSKKARLSEQ